MNLNINLIKKLKKITNFNIIECKKALNICNNNFDKALKYLNNFIYKDKNLLSYNEYKNGIIICKNRNDNKYGFIIKVSTETDFVSKCKEFLYLINDISDFCIKYNINNINILKNKYKNKISNLIFNTKENIIIDKFYSLSDEYIFSYTYMSKIGVLIKIKNNINLDVNIVKNISMHIIFNQNLLIKNNNKKNLDNNKLNNNNVNILKKQKYLLDKTKLVKDILVEKNILIINFKIIKL